MYIDTIFRIQSLGPTLTKKVNVEPFEFINVSRAMKNKGLSDLSCPKGEVVLFSLLLLQTETTRHSFSKLHEF